MRRGVTLTRKQSRPAKAAAAPAASTRAVTVTAMAGEAQREAERKRTKARASLETTELVVGKVAAAATPAGQRRLPHCQDCGPC